MKLFSLEKKVAVVTGAGSGIGQAIAVGIAEAGADVACFDRPGNLDMRGTVERIEKAGRRALVVEGDVMIDADLKRLVEETEKSLGALSLAVNCAGIANAEAAEKMPRDQWQKMIDVDLTGVFLSCQAEARVMLPRKRGSIVNGLFGKMAGTVLSFHGTHPFWQVAEFEAKEEKLWSVLAVEHNAYNAKMLFDHFDVLAGEKAYPSEVICWLAAAQTFAVSSGKSEIAHTSTAPSAISLLVFSMGRTLRETLLLNFPGQKRDVTEMDLPVWEREPETIASLKSKPGRKVYGRADLYTWGSRTVRLYCDDDGMVSRIGFASGMWYESVGSFPDPHAALVEHEKIGLLPMKLKQRGLWRDFDSLLPNRQQGNKSAAPLVIDHAITLCAELEDPAMFSVMVCGQVNDNAKIECWRMERFVLPTAILDMSIDVRKTIKHLLNMAEDWQSRLYKACKTFATECIRRDAERQPAAEDIKKVVEQMPCTTVYWSNLEYAFKQNLENGFTDPEQAQKLWRGKIRDALALAWDAQRDAVGAGDAWTIRAMTKAGEIVGKALKELNDPPQENQDEVGKGK